MGVVIALVDMPRLPNQSVAREYCDYTAKAGERTKLKPLYSSPPFPARPRLSPCSGVQVDYVIDRAC